MYIMISVFCRIVGFAGMSATLLVLACCGDDDCNPVSTDTTPVDTTSDSAFFTFGGETSDSFESIAQMPDGGFVMTGSTGPVSEESLDLWLVKTDSEGSQEWARTFVSEGRVDGRKVVVTPDGGLAVLGRDDAGTFLLKTDADGESLWEERIDEFHGEDIINTPDGGFAMTGSYGDIRVIKTDDRGNISWQASFDEFTTNEFGRSIVCTPDGGYAVSGDVWSGEQNGIDVVVLKVDDTGGLVWDTWLGRVENSWSEAIVCTSDGNLVATGLTQTYGCNLIKLSDSGEVIWEREFARSGYTEAYRIVETPDGGLVIAGESFSERLDEVGSQMDIFLAKTDASGNLQWLRSFGGDANDYGKGLACTASGGFAVAGYGDSFGAGSFDAYLLLTDEAGNVLK
jgi:hypothetical protein